MVFDLTPELDLNKKEDIEIEMADIGSERSKLVEDFVEEFGKGIDLL
jgi:hypothetical protein